MPNTNPQYEIFLERNVEKRLAKLPPEAFIRLVKAMKTLAANPRRSGARKLSGSKSDWRVRVGSYRILYEINDAKKQIFINWIGHRRDAYR